MQASADTIEVRMGDKVVYYRDGVRVATATGRAEILDTAKRAVMVDRAATHGDLEDNFAQLGRVWSARLGVEISAAQVAIMMIDLKTTRAWGNPGHIDSWVDMAGYAACGGEVSARAETVGI